MRLKRLITTMSLAAALTACKGREQTAATPIPQSDTTRSSASKDDDQELGQGNWADDVDLSQSQWGSEQQALSNPNQGQTTGGYPAGNDQQLAELGGLGGLGGLGVPSGGQQQPSSDPFAAVIPQLIKCYTDQSCDPEQAIMSLPPQTQQALMSALDQYESTGGGPLAPYAAQAQAAGIDLGELLY